MAVRAPHLYRSLRCFCLGAFALLGREIAGGAQLPFAFEGHESYGRPALYEYRPLVRPFVEARADELLALDDARIAVEDLTREPAAAIFARAHAGPKPSAEQAVFRTVLLPLVVATAEGCGGFDWIDSAFDRAYEALEESLLGKHRSYNAVAPLVGLSAGAAVDLGDGLRVRAAATGELAAHWPEAKGLLPRDFGREPDRLLVIELERPLDGEAAEPPDAPGEIADAVTALRLATAGGVSAGPVIFERLDWRPYGIRPALPISGTELPGEEIRLDSFRGRLARELRGRLGRADEDAELGDALDRWELSLFAGEPSRATLLRESLESLLGGGEGTFASVLRAAVLLGETESERRSRLAALRGLACGEWSPDAADAVRRALVETLLRESRAELLASLDDTLLGLRPRPAAVQVVASLAG